MNATISSMDYTFESGVYQEGLDFASSTSPTCGDSFFWGRLSRPRAVGQLLTCLHRVIQSRFYRHMPPMRDPVVTSQCGLLRWEGFSGCCGVYGRVDLDDRAFCDLDQAFGTTNVDFHSSIVSDLARLGNMSNASLRVTRQTVELQTETRTTIEKKVELPERWIRGFGEVQIYQSRLIPLCTIAPMTMSKLFQTYKSTGFGVQNFELKGSILTPVAKSSPHSIPIAGLERLRTVEPLLNSAERIQVWRDSEDYGVSAWRLEFDVGSFWLVLSPSLERGFSGEGQASELLAMSDWKEHLDRVLRWLGERSTLDPTEAASQLGLKVSDVNSVFAALAISGLAGFDAGSGYYYQRKLPFLTRHVERLHPRYRNAQSLNDESRIRILSRTTVDQGEDIHCSVLGEQCEYHVHLRPDRETCTCSWYNRYQGKRGDCKHVLGAKMFLRSLLSS